MKERHGVREKKGKQEERRRSDLPTDYKLV